MRLVKASLASIGILAVFATSATAQAVAFQPVIGSFPNGVTMSVTPSVSFDGRSARMSLNPQFTGLNGFTTYSVPAAVSGAGMGGMGFGGLPGGAAGFVGMNGPVGALPGPMIAPYQDGPPEGFGIGDPLRDQQPLNRAVPQRVGAAPKVVKKGRKKLPDRPKLQAAAPSRPASGVVGKP